ncbi:protein kinase [Cellulomonas cellasea]|uniref:serine/threonine-protein kinase n=1 Tax=Cellulomonas cellasea TaxID=43670 RepID=UPI0025A36D26|nr:serine/threonine-protein kinase [Cellulomonas cellasea]MDM8084131.1 protein kinase [Cellulomonas cellasea]
MTARRVASTPPQIAGHRFIRVLGLGGFADVFLYEQDLPRRLVAVKVLLAGSLDDDLRTGFRTEANLMAQLSHHPSIVTIHHADIAPDGRPYLVMEYCSGPALAERYRRERISVPEALRIAIRVGSAVETAHRAGILHRDIKPANVLTTDFGWPALTDFGIAATTGAGAGAALGMSIPWSPPELLAHQPHGDTRSDVYSLAATVYSLLAGRTPFEAPGSPNGAADVVARIERTPVASTGREDVPASLQAVLARAMAKDPDQRFATAAAFARALQQIEAALGFAVTPLDLPDDARLTPPMSAAQQLAASAPAAPASDDATRLRPVISIDSTGLPAQMSARTHAGAPRPPDPGHTVDPLAAVPPVGGRPSDARPAVALGLPAGVQSPRAVAPLPGAAGASGSPRVVGAPGAPADGGSSRRGMRRAIGSVSAVLVVAVLAGVAALTLGGRDNAPIGPGSTATELAAPTVGGVSTVVPAPAGLEGRRTADGVEFTWSNPDPAEGDQYLWGVRTATGGTELELVAERRVSVPAAPDEPVCVEVSIVRANRASSSQPAEACAP